MGIARDRVPMAASWPSTRPRNSQSRSLKMAYRSPGEPYVATSAALSERVRAAFTSRQPLPAFKREARFIVGGNWMRFFI